MEPAAPESPTRTPHPAPEFPELGFYGLAGHSAAPGDLIEEVRLAERLGLGAVFLSERFAYKDAAVLTGVAATASSRLGIATAATNHNTRHPLITAAMAATAHRVSGGRFALGLGRGFDPLFDMMGLPRITNAQLTDVVGLYRQLWQGEGVSYDGPAGKFPYLSMNHMGGGDVHERIPVLMVAIGPRTLELAGRIADAVVLHTFMTDEAVARAVATVRKSAADAGRDPASVRMWAVTAVIEDSIDEPQRLRRTVGRMASYLQGYGDVLIATNQWDPAALRRFRADPLVTGYSGAFDAVGTPDELRYLRDEVLPPEWLAAAITGTARSCAEQVRDQFGATGVDSIIMHGVTPAQLAPVIAEYRTLRPESTPTLPANPGWVQ